jgi:hypothetical protein
MKKNGLWNNSNIQLKEVDREILLKEFKKQYNIILSLLPENIKNDVLIEFKNLKLNTIDDLINRIFNHLSIDKTIVSLIEEFNLDIYSSIYFIKKLKIDSKWFSKIVNFITLPYENKKVNNNYFHKNFFIQNIFKHWLNPIYLKDFNNFFEKNKSTEFTIEQFLEFLRENISNILVKSNKISNILSKKIF